MTLDLLLQVAQIGPKGAAHHASTTHCSPEIARVAQLR
jgi:hypothetical protein